MTRAWSNYEVLQTVRQLQATPSPSQIFFLFIGRPPRSTSPDLISNVHRPLLEWFDGSPAHCSGFLLQCDLHFARHAGTAAERYKVALVISVLTGRALPSGRGTVQKCSPMSASPNSSVPFSTTLQRAEREVSVSSVYARGPGQRLRPLAGTTRPC